MNQSFQYIPVWEKYPDLFPNGIKVQANGGENTGGPSPMGAAIGPLAGGIGKGLAAQATTGAALGSSIGATIAGAAIPAAGLYGFYDLATDMKYKGDAAKKTAQGAASGAAVGSVVPGVGTALGALIGAGLGFASSQSGSGKDSHQVARDRLRSRAQEMGLLNADYRGLFGTDIGKDGGFRFGDGRRAYELQKGMEDGSLEGLGETQGQLAGDLNPLGYMLSDGDNHFTGQAVGMLGNDILESEGGYSADKVKQYYDRAGGFQKAFDAVTDMYRRGKLSEEKTRAAQNALNQLYETQGKASTDGQDMSLTGQYRSPLVEYFWKTQGGR